jgi:hypothetical protein
MSHTKDPEVTMLEHQLDVEGLKKPTELLAITDRIPLSAEIAHLTEAEQKRLERKIVRKMDYRLMPVVILMFWLNILDR